jgi:uncharacterized protein (TIGR03083 family)
MAADSISSNETYVTALEGLTPKELANLRFAVFGSERDVAGLARMRLSEHAIHTWDVAVALDPSATIAPTAATFLIDSVEQTLGYAGKPSGLYATVRVRTTEPARDLALVIGDTVSATPWSDGVATAELELPAEAFLRLVTGRLDPEHTPAVSVSGVELADLRKVFPGY